MKKINRQRFARTARRSSKETVSSFAGGVDGTVDLSADGACACVSDRWLWSFEPLFSCESLTRWDPLVRLVGRYVEKLPRELQIINTAHLYVSRCAGLIDRPASADTLSRDLYEVTMNRQRLPMGIILFAVLLYPVSAETIAVAVAYHDAEDRALVLGELVEQGAMEYLFQQGHIVFNIDVDPENDHYAYRAIDEAREGGASYLFIIDVAWDVAPARGLLPRRLLVRAIAVTSEEEITRSTLDAASFDRFAEMNARAMAERIGAAGAEAALDGMRRSAAGGGSTW